MEPEQVPSAPAPATSRRELRAAADRSGNRASRRAARTSRARSTLTPWALRWGPRTAVLSTLAAATIAFPVVDATTGTDVELGPGTVSASAAAAGLPTAYEVLSSTLPQATPTTLLAAGSGPRAAAEPVSRSLEREPLPGCDGDIRTTAPNGQIPQSDLCSLWDPDHALRGDAAVALSELNLNFRAAFDRDLCLTDSYRPLSVQRRLAVTKPGLAATPGLSNHGWGLAIDLCSSETASADAMAWLRTNGPVFGWENPAWARRGGSGPYEPWHWEYVPGTEAMGTNWS
ncbi:D-Ala-D-Ala carboxypeptidase [Actinotalea ferrariae CF5-4]|uniref:D-Ala-D-Ala carboxypeptidase n=1 Tax=Actinotalea ferrariae CF5-4 TaxID=948458 RepID=A0A021VRY0_9CELL|nr:M15 family metallopeptidase [Actinotalea ferrariae]EYR63901.1 D-Ala-D-Ala carboxypeptidase [Actinotalea ferrariae CF5-4]